METKGSKMGMDVMQKMMKGMGEMPDM